MKNSLNIFIDNMMESLQCSTHLKDLKTGKYLASNLINARKFGFDKAESIIGATIYNLNEFMLPFWGSDIVPDTIKQEQEIRHTGKITIDKGRHFLTKDGFVCLHYMKKIPVPNKNGIIKSVFTISENVTNELTLIELWSIYKNYYQVNKILAIQKYLIHLGVSDLFNECPTESELKILIALTKADSYKKIASLLHISTKTVEYHLSNLKYKIKNLDLAEVCYLMKIADPHERIINE